MTDLAELTTMRVGGPAAELVTATTDEQIVQTALRAWGRGDELLALGGGSNLVVADDGFDGTVLAIRTAGIHSEPADAELTGSTETESTDAGVLLTAKAGEDWDGLVAHTTAAGWSGLEALSGIPGRVGAAPVQNIGAYGQELSDTLVDIEFLDYEAGEVLRLSADELRLGYRASAIKAGRAGIVLSVRVLLRPTGVGPVRYAQLASALGVEVGQSAPVAQIRDAVLALRAAKGMVLDPADPDTASCGSFFTNPIVPERLSRTLPADAPRWPLAPPPPDRAVPLGSEPAAPPPPEDASIKLSAAWLIERAGIARGFALPGSRAAISSKHTLAITNRGGASAGEVAELARFVQMRVAAEFGIELAPEPVLLGLTM